MYEIIDKYIDKLMTSKPDMPLWNIESIRLGRKPKWNYIDGCMMTSLIELYKITKDEKYIKFVKDFISYYIAEDGSILGFEPDKQALDDVCESKILFDLYSLTGEEKYKKAIDITHKFLMDQPRTKDGSFWHKKIYPNQVWLDGIYMAMPFYARYQTQFAGKNYNDLIDQLKLVRKYMFDENKQLYYHGYDSSKEAFWADKKTGLSKSFWLRSIGWYTVALADLLDYVDEQLYDEYHTIRELLKEVIDGLLKYQDKESKMFYQVVDQGDKKGNYLETSGSSMIAYAILKGTRLEALPPRYRQIGVDIFNGIAKKYLTIKDGELNLGGICLSAGLGPKNNTRRDGTFEYYISEPIVENDAKGVGPFILAYTEMKKIEA